MKVLICRKEGDWFFKLLSGNGRSIAESKPCKKKATLLKTLKQNLPDFKIVYDSTALQ